MPIQQLLYIIFSLVSSAFMITLGVYGLRQRENPSASWFALVASSVLVWSLGCIAEIFAPDVAGKIFWSKVQYLGIATFPAFWLVCVSFFTGYTKKFRPSFIGLFAIPIITVLVAWSNELHHLLWTNVYMVPERSVSHPTYEYGWYFYIHTFYSYALSALSFLLLLRGRLNSQRGQQRQFALLLGSFLFPVLGSLSYLLGFVSVDTTPIGFALASIFFAGALFRLDFMRQLPLPYHEVFYHLEEAVVVLNFEEKLLEFNDKARDYFQLADSAITQKLALPFFTELQASRTLDIHFHNRVLAVKLKEISAGKMLRGYLLSAKDISLQKQSEALLEAQLEKLNALVITNDSLQQQQNREAVYREAISVTFEMTTADLASLLLYDERSDTLKVVASQERNPRRDTAFIGQHMKRVQGLSWQALEAAKAVFLQNPDGIQSSHVELERATEWLGIPLLDASGKAFGVLSVRILSPQKTLAGSDKVFLEAIAQTCSNVLLRLGLLDIANAKASAYLELYSAADRQARELTILDKVRTALARELDPQQVLTATASAIHDMLEHSTVALYLLEQGQLTAKSYIGFESALSLLALDVGIVRRSLRDREVIFLADATTHAKFHAELPEVQSALAIPLFDSQGAVGVLSVETPLGVYLNEADVRLMTILGEQVSFALERAKLYEDLKTREERLRLLADNTRDVIAWHDTAGHFLYVTPAIKLGFGYTPEEILDRKVSEYAHPDDVLLLRNEVLPKLLGGEAVIGQHYRVKHKNGHYLWVETFAQPLFDDAGKVTGFVASSRDITERKRLQEQMLEGALLYDNLTNLPNRALFMDRLKHAAQRSARGNHDFAVLFLDLDRFKIVNDSLGHNAGDQLLVGIAERLQNCVRPQDTVARLGGDEFAILLEDMDEAGAYSISERIQLSLKKPFDIAGREVQTTISIGITLSKDIADPEQLMRNADVAMYHAKNNGRARYAIFDATMHDKVIETMQLEVELRNALEHGELRVHYQPIADIKSGQISGVEALVRWYHPVKGIIQPGSFITIAEDTGLIQQIDAWVLQEATRQMKHWQVTYGRNLTVSVNLSTKNFRLNDLADKVLASLEMSQLNAKSLKLEITESVFMDNLETGLNHLQRLREAGVSLQIDDFGTGYSSLSYLHQLPLDSLKIDRSFIWQLDSGEKHKNGEIVRTIISLARSLNLTVVAEGIETEAQLRILEILSCDYGQGFYFAKPLPAQELEALLKTNHPFGKASSPTH
jgi:diguanylate cyclase (GGDEF)-like protein/PAS domain S-box-containing protein